MLHITTFALLLILPWNQWKNITMLGTLGKKKPDIPPSFQTSRDCELLSSKFGFKIEHHDMMCWLVPQVVVPQGRYLIEYYALWQHTRKYIFQTCSDSWLWCNGRGGDTLDQLVNNYTCKRITKRWPMTIFYWMLGVATYISAVCFMEI